MSTYVYSAGLLSLSACTDDTDEEVTAEVNLQHPTGTASGWQIAPDSHFYSGQPNPCPCELEPGRRHILFIC